MQLVSIFNFNFNVEVGGQTIISKSVTLRTFVVFSKSPSQTLELVFSRFIQPTYRMFNKTTLKRARVSGSTEIRSEIKMYNCSLMQV
jgi:lipoate-protein ligase A